MCLCSVVTESCCVLVFQTAGRARRERERESEERTRWEGPRTWPGGPRTWPRGAEDLAKEREISGDNMYLGTGRAWMGQGSSAMLR